MQRPPKHAVLRDGARWEGAHTRRLEASPEGALTLRRVAGARPGREIDLPEPWAVPPSGLAPDGSGGIFLADTAGDAVIHLDAVCGTRVTVTGLGFDRPRGLAVSGERLFVADSGNGRIQVFRLPSLEVVAVWPDLGEPTDLAADGEGRIYVVDARGQRLIRLSALGALDTAWNAAISAQPEFTAPRFLAVDAGGHLFASDGAARAVFHFDPDGDLAGVLEWPEAGEPGALTVHADVLYAADTRSGALRAWNVAEEIDLGSVPGFRGPVTALACDERALLVKTDETASAGTTSGNVGERAEPVDPAWGRGMSRLGHSATSAGGFRGQPELPDERSVTALPWGAGNARRGLLAAGPLDAGVGQTWERVHVEGRAPASSSLELSIHLAKSPAEPPDASTWQRAASLDTLVPPPPRDGTAPPGSARYLWLHVELTSADGRAAPWLAQVEASTTAPSYLDDLPAVYARRDEAVAGGFLRRWLALFRAELGDEERLLDTMARRFDPRTAPRDWLAALAGWVAVALPDGADTDARRALIEAAHELHTRRGTIAGVREAVLRETGLCIQLLEAHHERRIWQLGVTSRLGLDTALPPADPAGLIVPDPTAELVVGEYVVGGGGPLEPGDFVTPLVNETAHLFTAVLPPDRCVDDALRARVREVLDAEKPAHTDYHLCQTGPRMRVGFQARVGLDTLVAGGPEPMRLGGVQLGRDSVLGDPDALDRAGRVGRNARIGRSTVLV